MRCLKERGRQRHPEFGLGVSRFLMDDAVGPRAAVPGRAAAIRSCARRQAAFRPVRRQVAMDTMP
ncbi:hypothetical protein DVR11_26265 [Paracoccus versutus]|nr:hypothetical protein DVR11_26265 [Paracoccus versutus]